MEWGYKPSDVERLLLGEEQADNAHADDSEGRAESADAAAADGAA